MIEDDFGGWSVLFQNADVCIASLSNKILKIDHMYATCKIANFR